MERKLATIVKIDNIQPIPDADSIELAYIRGWKVVVRKGEYKVGDLAIYYEIDSFLPVKPEFEFLRKTCYKRLPTGEEGFRLKTIKLRGQISQGLLTPLTFDGKEGDDVTEFLGITKYEPPIPAVLAGSIKGAFPSFIQKTDEIRIQNYESEVGKLPTSQRCYITEKIDGTSFTCYVKNGVFGVCGRNWELTENDDNSLWRIAKALNLKDKLLSIGKNIALQGELFGSNINGNIYKLKNHKLNFFTGLNIDENRRLQYDELEWLLYKLDLEMVPIIEYGYILPENNLIDAMLNYADGVSQYGDNVPREGIVVRGLDSQFSFKAISNTYLIKKQD